jgi:TRAP-type C4-dicarboxylate transport system substrate-binding protein
MIFQVEKKEVLFMRNIKSILVLNLVLILALSILLAGCTAESETKTITTTKTATETATTQPVQPIELTLAYGAPGPVEGVFDFQDAIQEWAERIEEETDGRVKITIYPGGSLLTAPDALSGLEAGMADIVQWDTQRDPGRFVLNSIFELPGIYWGEDENRLKVVKEMFKKFPELEAEFGEDVKILAIGSCPSFLLGMVDDTPVHTPADIKGRRIACGGSQIYLVEAWGAVGVDIDPAERYMSLERGLVDGSLATYGGTRAFSWYEVLGSFTENIGLPQLLGTVIMSKSTFDSLPEDIQKVFDDLEWWFWLEYTRGYSSALLSEQVVVDYGSPIYQPTTEEFELWSQPLELTHEEWIQEREAKGLPARAMYEEMMSLVEEYCR